MTRFKIVCWGEAERLFAGRDSFLRREDCEVLLATSAREVLDLVRRTSPDLVLLDQEVVGRELQPVCRALKANRRISSIPIVVMVASLEDPESMALGQLGVEGVLQKPSAHKVSSTLARLLGVSPREHPRFVFEAPARVLPDGAPAPLPSRTLDLSLQGAQLEIEHPVQLGSELTLNLPLPGRDEVLTLKATVVRIMADPLWGRNRLGLRFVSLDESARARLESFLLQLAEAEEKAAGRPPDTPRRYLF